MTSEASDVIFTAVRKSTEALLADDADASAADVAARSQALEEREAQDILRAAIQVHGRGVVISTAFGAGGLCVLHMAQQIDPGVRSYYIDTGFAFPETEALAERWVSERRLNLLRVVPRLTPEEQAAKHGEALWARDPDACCALRKVEPNQRALDGATLWITALRRDESPTRTHAPMLARVAAGNGGRILKLAPIARWNEKDVWRYIHRHELPYNPLHDRGYPSIGCTHCTTSVAAGGGERDGRWAGLVKKECGLHRPAEVASEVPAEVPAEVLSGSEPEPA
jgi:phosphoadenosine phosphosulfate reductase